MSQFPIIHNPASAFQEQQVVKLFKKHCRWLVNSAQNRLACVRQPSQEADNVVRRKRVQPGRWLIQEEKQFRLAGQFNSNRQPLALLLIETHATGANHCARDGPHFQQVDDLLAVVVLFLDGHFSRLPKESGESKGLANCSRRLVYVHLLGKGSGPLEAFWKWSVMVLTVALRVSVIEGQGHTVHQLENLL